MADEFEGSVRIMISLPMPMGTQAEAM
jgi:hypothetical protein